MIIVRLMGGLGNQMFQYAAGRRLAILHNVPLKLDRTLLGRKLPGLTSRTFALAPFHIQSSDIGLKEFLRLSMPSCLLDWCACNFLHVYEKHFHFDPTILELPRDVCLEGYWQSEKYFYDVANVIRSEFSVKAPLSGFYRDFAGIVMNNNSVSVHVRRGDYLTNPLCNDLHGSCGIEYYRAAIEMISERIRNPHFYFFSDDPDWVRESISFKYPMTVVGHNGIGHPHEDLRLMSLCRHHIVANSTFSWWGAWLSVNPDKIVIAPVRWFRDASINVGDLYPDGWLKI